MMNMKKIVALLATIATLVSLFSCMSLVASAEGDLKWSISFSKLNGDVFEPVTAVEPGEEYYIAVGVSNYDAIGEMELAYDEDGVYDYTATAYNNVITCATIFIDCAEGAELDTSKIVSPYDNATFETNFKNNQLRVIMWTDKASAGLDYSIGNEELASNDGVLFYIKATAGEKEGTLSYSINQGTDSAATSIATINKAAGVSFNALTQVSTIPTTGYDVAYSITVSAYEPVVLPELKVKTIAMVLQSSISLQYKVEKSLFGKDAYADPHMTFVICGRKSEVTEYTVSGDYYVFTLKQIAPNELTQTITATLYATANGKEYTAVKDYTAATYCYKVLEAYAAYPSQAKLLTLIVDLLNYGTQAQIYSNRYTDNLANAALTDAQKAFGTSETPTLKNTFNSKYETVENPTVKWKTKGLTLEDAVVMRFVFTTESIDGVTVKIKAAGKEFIMTEDDIKYDASANTYTVLFSSLDASMMSEPVYVTVYKDGVAASNTMLDTIESYAQQNQGVAKLGDLVIAMMKYGNAAKAYVGK